MELRAVSSTWAIRPKSNSASVGVPSLDVVTYKFPEEIK
jgi:hypothetical protein